MSTRLSFSRDAKIQKKNALEKLGVHPYPYRFETSHTITQARKHKNNNVIIAGRVMSIREHGKITFCNLLDETESVQIMFKKDDLGKQYALLGSIDPGDHLGISGKVSTSKTGELTIIADSLTVLSKSLRPLPTAWKRIDDPEIRYRKRYLDLLINPNTKRVLDARWKIEKELRRYLQDKHNFTEVETPILQPLYGGTNARPFTTFMNALDNNFYLRVAPELYLKRLIVGGYERIFEIARNFRNEGIDTTHQPEFTMVEWYEAYADYQRMMDTAESLIKHLAKKIHGKQRIVFENTSIQLGKSWPRITIKHALKTFAKLDVDILSDTELSAELSKNNLTLTGSFSRGKAVFSLFDHLVTPTLIQPTWIIDYPKEVSPLAKEHRVHPELVERFECYIGGKEICDGWSEITDSLEQKKRFDVEQKHMREGDEEAQPMDQEFLEAMEYGMPPLGGIGIGIDRLVMMLTNTWSIKEVIAFPTLRPIHLQQPSIKKQTKTVRDKKTALPSRKESEKLLHTYIKNSALIEHCEMVAKALEASAKHLGENAELWYQTGLLHDLDWEQFPDEHPNKALQELLVSYPEQMRTAIAAHAPHRTNVEPTTTLGQYLFASDELCGLMKAASRMRPDGFTGMQVKSVKKKIKDKAFARNVSREDIYKGFELIKKTPEEYIEFLIHVFQQ